jgi:hypothetical protein
MFLVTEHIRHLDLVRDTPSRVDMRGPAQVGYPRALVA